MNNAWILQANPRHYDIDAAIQALESIWWRTPQYATEIAVGDITVLWRSGEEAGVIGIGRVIDVPQEHGMEDDDRRFVLHDNEAVDSTTRTLVSVQPVPFVSKERVQAVPELSSHQIVTAPMGTVFKLSETEWAALAAHLPPAPELPNSTVGRSLPAALAWEQRARGVMPMPGGYDGYLVATRQVCEVVNDVRPTSAELVERFQELFNLREAGSRLRESFLRKVGLFRVESGTLQLTNEAHRWLDSDDDRILIALLHSRCQFIGEMIFELEKPCTTDDLLAVVNDRYGLNWESKTQISNRRDWLQSAGMVTADRDGLLVATDAGRALCRELSVQPASTVQLAPKEVPTADVAVPGVAAADTAPQPVFPVETLAEELEVSATDSTNPDRFERAVRDAFAFLGFDAEWLGGSGRTDVLLDAPLAKGESYRVAVDAKTTGSGALPDHQVDWATLVEHRERHQADYALLVGPNPSPGRLMERARNHGISVLSARELAGLCRQHARTQLGLTDYRTLFMSSGEVDTSELEERADEVARLSKLAATICRTLLDKGPTFGRLNARDLWLMLASSDELATSSEAEIQTLLDTLASPLIGALACDTSGYMTVMSPKVIQTRFTSLGQTLHSED